MNKYIRGFGCAIVGTIKTIVLKIERGSKAQIAFPALISLNTEVIVDKDGMLSVGRRISMRNGSRLVVREKGRIKIGNSFYMNSGV